MKVNSKRTEKEGSRYFVFVQGCMTLSLKHGKAEHNTRIKRIIEQPPEWYGAHEKE